MKRLHLSYAICIYISPNYHFVILYLLCPRRSPHLFQYVSGPSHWRLTIKRYVVWPHGMNHVTNLNGTAWLGCPEHEIYEVIIMASIIVQTGKPCYKTTRLVIFPWQNNKQIFLGTTRISCRGRWIIWIFGKKNPHGSRKMIYWYHKVSLKN